MNGLIRSITQKTRAFTTRCHYSCLVESTPNTSAIKIIPVTEHDIICNVVDPETNDDFQFAMFDRTKFGSRWSGEIGEIPLITDMFQSTQNADQVFLSKYFLSVTFSEHGSSSTLHPPTLQPLCEIVDDFFKTGPANSNTVSLWQQYMANTANTTNNINHDELNMEDRQLAEDIQRVLEEKVRPTLHADGGDVVFHSYKDGVVILSLVGACSSCSSSTITMRFMIKNLLMFVSCFKTK
jgi:Fe-S cluster biogenesis protein NfuA